MPQSPDNRPFTPFVFVDPQTGKFILPFDASGLFRLTAGIASQDFSGAVGASATISGATRDVGVALGAPMPFSKFNVVALATVGGTISLRWSDDGSAWSVGPQAGVTANVAALLSMPIFARFCSAQFASGLAGGNVVLRSSFSVF